MTSITAPVEGVDHRCYHASMNQPTWTAVDDFISRVMLGPDAVQESTLRANAAAHLPAIDVAPNQGKLLYLLAKIRGAKRILEIGTLGGYSTIWLARALPADGRLVTLEFSEVHAAVAAGNIAHAGFTDRVEIRTGPALESLAEMAGEGEEPFDFIFLDADKPNNPHYLDWAIRFSRPGTIILGDNVVRDGEITNPATTDDRVIGSRQLLENMGADPRLEATALQTVGLKGYDGFAIALVKS
jgi:predicted O-methyltransferase YrrM